MYLEKYLKHIPVRQHHLTVDSTMQASCILSEQHEIACHMGLDVH